VARSTSGQNVTFTLTNGLPAPGATLTVRQTTQGAQFVRMAGAKIAPRWTADLVHPCGCYGDRVHDFYRDARAELLLRCYSATLTQRALPAPIHTRMTFRVTPKDHRSPAPLFFRTRAARSRCAAACSCRSRLQIQGRTGGDRTSSHLRCSANRVGQM
jgi:hypothetical protein